MDRVGDDGGPATPAAAALAARIDRLGPQPWSVVVEAALYGPGGFYATGGGAGRRRDFLTSPELGPLFGAVLARALDAEWEAHGRPDPWVVVEAGAGAGTLAAAVLAAPPACGPALRYLLVERSAPLRSAAAAVVALEEPAELLGPQLGPSADPETADFDGGYDEGAGPPAGGAGTGRGPLAAALEELPVGPVRGVVVANELLDNLPFDIYARSAGAWVQRCVGHDGERFTELGLPADPAVAAHLERLVPGAPDGAEVPWQRGAAAWLRRALATLSAGRVLLIDYGRTTAEMAAAGRSAWLRTYRAGGPGRPPLEVLGQQDVTSDVAVDQLALVRPPARVRTQAEWLADHGLAILEAEAAAAWQAAAARPDLAALRARSRLTEAAALGDPAGLGAFVVMEWAGP